MQHIGQPGITVNGTADAATVHAHAVWRNSTPFAYRTGNQALVGPQTRQMIAAICPGNTGIVPPVINPTPVSPTSPVPPVTPGPTVPAAQRDVNGDSQITQADIAVIAARFGARTSASNYLQAADVNRDGIIDHQDAWKVRFDTYHSHLLIHLG